MSRRHYDFEHECIVGFHQGRAGAVRVPEADETHGPAEGVGEQLVVLLEGPVKLRVHGLLKVLSG